MRQCAVMGIVVMCGVLASACDAWAVYATGLVYPQEDDTYLYKLALWTTPDDSPYYVLQWAVACNAIPDSGFGPSGWRIRPEPEHVIWLVEDAEYMIPPGEVRWGFGFASPDLCERLTYIWYGYDPETGNFTKYRERFSPELVPEPAWMLPLAAALVLGAVRAGRLV